MLSGRVHGPISDGELERRWVAVRAAMEAEGVDVLIAQADNDFHGGVVRYLTDVPAVAGVTTTVVFPREDEMTVVMHGAHGGRLELEAGTNGEFRGVREILTTPAFPGVAYAQRLSAELVADSLERYPGATIGLFGPGQISHLTGQVLAERFDTSAWIDLTDLVDAVKMIKSPEELDLIRATARLQDEAMKEAIAAIEPGRREGDISAAAQYAVQRRGSEQGIFMVGSGPWGEPAPIALRHNQNRVLREGDVVSLLIETNGPGGLYTEIGRACVIGEPPAEAVEELEFALEARRFCLSLLVPGAEPAAVWGAYNEFLRANDRPVETRLHCHGQGTDLVERPLIRPDETLRIEAGMNMACHPSYVRNGLFTWICDNYLIRADGPSDSIHSFPATLSQV
jgi:Xaa-Pro aminopeptidase